MYVPISFHELFVVALFVSTWDLHWFQTFFICGEFILSSPLEGGRKKLNLLQVRDFIFFNIVNFEPSVHFGTSEPGIVLHQSSHVPFCSFLTTFYLMLPKGEEWEEKCYFGERRVCDKVRVGRYAPRLSAKMMPLCHQTAARKNADGSVGLLGRGVAWVRRCSRSNLGIPVSP